MLKFWPSGKFTNQFPTPFELLCVCDHLGTWPVLFRGKLFMPAGSMTSFNVSVVPIYSFSTKLIDCCRNCTETSLNTDLCFPRIRLPVVLSQLTAISWHLFQPQLPSYEVHCWEKKGRGQVLLANPQPPGMTAASFLPWSWSASPDASECIQTGSFPVYPGRPCKYLNMPKIQISSCPLPVQVGSFSSLLTCTS